MDKSWREKVIENWEIRLCPNKRDVDEVETEQPFLDATELDEVVFWKNCSKWIAFKGGVSLPHVIHHDEELRSGSNRTSFGTWRAVADFLIRGTVGESPNYFVDSDGYYCMLISSYNKPNDLLKILEKAFNPCYFHGLPGESPRKCWNIDILRRWDCYDSGEEELELSNVICSNLRKAVAIIKIRRCDLALPPSSVLARMEAMFEVAERRSESYKIPDTIVLGMEPEEVMSARVFILKVKGNCGISIAMLDGIDDPTFPIMADVDGCVLQASLLSGPDFWKEDFLDLCDILSGDAYERDLWRRCFHEMDAHAIQEWKNGAQETRKSQIEASCKESWKVMFGDEEEGTCPYCLTHMVARGDFGTSEVHRSHILPALWGNITDKRWWNIIPTCCNLNQPRARPSNSPNIFRAEENGDDIRVEHMLISLLDSEYPERVRSIALKFFERMLKHPLCPINIIGKSSLLGFTLGFYGISAEPLRTDRWNFLFLSSDEIQKCWNLMQDRSSQNNSQGE